MPYVAIRFSVFEFSGVSASRYLFPGWLCQYSGASDICLKCFLQELAWLV
jgi:hypothetical protein